MPGGRKLQKLPLTLACALLVTPSAFAAGDAFRILHHEAVKIAAEPAPDGRERLALDAYGQRFELELEPNERVARAFGRPTAAAPLRGTVHGAARSWARLTRSEDGRWQGMFSDGIDVYAIEPASAVVDALVQPAADDDVVIFRLSDAVLPGTAQCGTATSGHETTAKAALESLGAEAGAPSASATSGSVQATRRLVVGVIADEEFVAFFERQGTAPETAIVQRMNVVDGIFSAQLGVRIELAPPTVFRTGDPFSRTDANGLLEELRKYRAGSSAEMSRGITHLMTGRDMDGETVGIAYLGSVCGGGAAASLSEGIRSTTSAALIAAHEIAHNFNAPHDGDTGGACAATAQNFLMAPRLNGSQQFSSCSVDQMRPLANGGWCLTSVDAPAPAPAPSPAPAPAPAPPPPDPSSNGAPSEEGGGGTLGLATVIALTTVGLALRRRRARNRL